MKRTFEESEMSLEDGEIIEESETTLEEGEIRTTPNLLLTLYTNGCSTSSSPPPPPPRPPPITENRRMFECKTCNRKFQSFQALGGHRASHSRPKLSDAEHLLLLKNSASTPVKPKMHQCSICGLEFTIGQALGGHMRKHRSKTEEDGQVVIAMETKSAKSSVPVLKRLNSKRVLCLLDLNLMPWENDLKIQLRPEPEPEPEWDLEGKNNLVNPNLIFQQDLVESGTSHEIHHSSSDSLDSRYSVRHNDVKTSCNSHEIHDSSSDSLDSHYPVRQHDLKSSSKRHKIHHSSYDFLGYCYPVRPHDLKVPSDCYPMLQQDLVQKDSHKIQHELSLARASLEFVHR